MFRIAIITVSDRSYKEERADLAGPALVDWAATQNLSIQTTKIVPDEQEEIEKALKTLVAEKIDLILTTGGTGLAPRDVTPEATKNVIEKEVPGLAEYMRAQSVKITPHGILSRAVCGIKDYSLIINLPGSPKAAVENISFLEKALPHALKLVKNQVVDCANE